MTNTASKQRCELPATPAAARIGRQQVALACDGLDVEQTHTAQLLTSEIVTNAVRHASHSGHARGAGITMSLCRTATTLRVEVSDQDPRPLPPARHPSAPLESGLGLHLVSQLATRWGSRPLDAGAGKMVWFEIEIGSGQR